MENTELAQVFITYCNSCFNSSISLETLFAENQGQRKRVLIETLYELYAFTKKNRPEIGLPSGPVPDRLDFDSDGLKEWYATAANGLNFCTPTE